MAMGRFGTMRRMLNHVLLQAPQDINFGSYQCIFSHKSGNQKLYREMMRRDAGLTLKEGLNVTRIKDVRVEAAACLDGSFEFGIGLDYGSEIGLDAVFAKDDTEWIQFADDTSHIRYRAIVQYLGRIDVPEQWLLVTP
jgi:hypothetical protein